MNEVDEHRKRTRGRKKKAVTKRLVSKGNAQANRRKTGKGVEDQLRPWCEHEETVGGDKEEEEALG